VSRGFIAHLHPPEVSETTLRFRATFGLGLILVILFLLTAVTGAFLMLYYVPSPTEARGTILDITHAVTFGAFIRALHRIAGHAMVLVVAAHLLRVWLYGAYIGKPLNFFVGVILFLLTLGLAFTGYLLPWDHLAFWAVTVSSNLADHVPFVGGVLKRMLLGDDAVGGAALVRFYALHTAVLPLAVFLLSGYHLFRLRRDGGLARPAIASRTVPASHLMIREAALAALVVLALFIAAMLWPAPVGGPPDFHRPSDPEKTPWYFLFLQEMVSYSTPVGGFVFPLAIITLLLALPLIDTDTRLRGRPFGDLAEKRAFLIAILVGVATFIAAELVFHAELIRTRLDGASPLFRDLINPASLMLVLAFGLGGGALKRSQSRRSALLAIGAVLVVAVIGFTIMGACRGPGWILTLPWEAFHAK